MSKRESVYLDTAKEIIKILAPLKSYQAFDNESKRFLDFALMDYIRELNKQPDIRQKIGGKHVNLSTACFVMKNKKFSEVTLSLKPS